jgi:capsular exopolysaccharide synthesis family protein
MYSPLADGATSPSRAIVPVQQPVFAAPAPIMPGYAPKGPEILYGGFNQTWLAHCLRRRWLMAILLGSLFGAGATGLLMMLFPSMSQVTSYLKVKSRPEEIFTERAAVRPSAPEIERQAMNHLTLLKSPLVLQAALAKQDIADLDAVRHQNGDELLWLMNDLKVSFPGDGEILEIRYEGEEDALQMEKIVKAVVQAYMDRVLFQDKLLSFSTQEDLKTVLKATETQLQNHLKQLQETMTSKGQATAEVEIPTLQRQVAKLEDLIVTARKELVDIDVFMKMAAENANSPATIDAAVNVELDKDPTMAMYQQQLFELNQQLQSRMSTSKNPADSLIKKLQTQIEQTEATRANYRARTEKQIKDQIRRMPNDALRQAKVEHDIRYKYASDNLKKYEQELEDANTKLMNLGVQDPDIEMLKANIESEGEIVKNLKEKILEWDVIRQASDKPQGGSGLETVSVIQEATGLADTNTVERFAIAGVGGFAAMALTCYGIALLEFRKRRLNGPMDMDDGLGIRVLGVLPPTTLKGMAGSGLVATQVAEALDNVRATLMHDSTSGPRQVVMCTSSAAKEGTTIVASSLALSLSRAGRRTLLVDADLRSPALHRLFGMPLEDGLSEVLRAEIDVSDAVRPTNNDGLYLLTAGVCSAEAIHSLATDQPQAVFEKLRDQFDFVVIDGPPVLGISDALSICQYVDGAIVTVLRDHSEIYKVYKAVELLRNMGVRLIGAVVNGVPLKADLRVVRLHQAQAQRLPRLEATTNG